MSERHEAGPVWPQTVWVCPKHGVVMPGSPWATEHDDELIHTPTFPCNRICQETDVVPREHLEQAERDHDEDLELYSAKVRELEARCQQLEEALRAVHRALTADTSRARSMDHAFELIYAALRGQPVGGDET